MAPVFGYEPAPKEKLGEAKDKIGSGLQEGAEGLGDAARLSANRVGDAYNQGKERVSDSAREARDKVNEAVESVKDVAYRMMDAARPDGQKWQRDQAMEFNDGDQTRVEQKLAGSVQDTKAAAAQAGHELMEDLAKDDGQDGAARRSAARARAEREVQEAQHNISENINHSLESAKHYIQDMPSSVTHTLEENHDIAAAKMAEAGDDTPVIAYTSTAEIIAARRMGL